METKDTITNKMGELEKDEAELKEGHAWMYLMLKRNGKIYRRKYGVCKENLDIDTDFQKKFLYKAVDRFINQIKDDKKTTR